MSTDRGERLGSDNAHSIREESPYLNDAASEVTTFASMSAVSGRTPQPELPPLYVQPVSRSTPTPNGPTSLSSISYSNTNTSTASNNNSSRYGQTSRRLNLTSRQMQQREQRERERDRIEQEIFCHSMMVDDLADDIDIEDLEEVCLISLYGQVFG